MAEKTYGELLKDPRWQRKRLEILGRDDFECTNCESRKKTLHVNHRWYAFKKKPWEYDDHVLETLCEDCHAEVTRNQKRIKTALAFVPSYNFDQIASYIETLFAVRGPGEVSVASYNEAQGVADALGVTAEMVIDKLRLPSTCVHTEELEDAGIEIRRRLRRERNGHCADVGTDEVD